MKLIEIGQFGQWCAPVASTPLLDSVLEATARLYRQAGFVRPWIGYVAIEDEIAVGTCAFKSPPINGRVEIAYFTFPSHEGRGVATRMGRQLIRLADQHPAPLVLVAQTLPQENASTAVLQKLGFRRVGVVESAEDGIVWQWERHGPAERSERS